MSFTEQELTEIDFQLRCLPMFSDLKDKARATIKAATVLFDLDVGQPLMEHDKVTTPAVYLILSGHIWLQYPEEARVMMVSGCIFGQELMKMAAALAKEKGVDTAAAGVAAPFTVTAKSKLRCAQIPWQVCHAIKPSLASSALMGESVDPMMRRRARPKMMPSSPEQPQKPGAPGLFGHVPTNPGAKAAAAATTATTNAAPRQRRRQETTVRRPNAPKRRQQSTPVASTSGTRGATAAGAAPVTRERSLRRDAARPQPSAAESKPAAAAAAAAAPPKAKPAAPAPPKPEPAAPATAANADSESSAAPAASTSSPPTDSTFEPASENAPASPAFTPAASGPTEHSGRRGGNKLQPAPSSSPAATASTRESSRRSDTNKPHRSASPAASPPVTPAPAGGSGRRDGNRQQRPPTGGGAPAPSSRDGSGRRETIRQQATSGSRRPPGPPKGRELNKPHTSSPSPSARAPASLPAKEGSGGGETNEAKSTPDARNAPNSPQSATELEEGTASSKEKVNQQQTDSPPASMGTSEAAPVAAPVAAAAAAAAAKEETTQQEIETLSLSAEMSQPPVSIPSPEKSDVPAIPQSENDTEKPQSPPSTDSEKESSVTLVADAAPPLSETENGTEESSPDPSPATTDAVAEHPIIVAKRRAMAEAAYREEYVTAGQIQLELNKLLRLFEAAEHPVISAKRRAMEEAAQREDYVTAGYLQVELNKLIQLFEAVEESAKKEDYETAGRWEAELRKVGAEGVDTNTSIEPSTPTPEADPTTSPPAEAQNTQEAETTKSSDNVPTDETDSAEKNATSSPIDAATEAATPSGTPLDSTSATADSKPHAPHYKMEMSRAVGKARSRASRGNDFGASSSSGEWSVTKKEKRSSKSRNRKEKDSSEDEPVQERKSLSHRKHRRNRSSLGDSKSDDEMKDDGLQKPKRSSKHKKSSRKSKERNDGAEEKEESKKKDRAQKNGDAHAVDDSEGSLDFVAESKAGNDHSYNHSSASSVDLGEDSKNRFVASKTFFEKTSNSSQNLCAVNQEAQNRDNGSKSPLHGSRGSFHDSRGSKHDSQLGVSASLFQNRDDDGTEGSLDLFENAEGSENKEGVPGQKIAAKHLSETSGHSAVSSSQGSGIDEDSAQRIAQSRNYFHDAEKPSSENPELLGAGRKWEKGVTGDPRADDSSDTSLDLLGKSPSAKNGTKQNVDGTDTEGNNNEPKESSDQSLHELADELSALCLNLNLLGETESPNNSLTKMVSHEEKESSDHSLDLMGATALKANAVSNNSSDGSLDLFGGSPSAKTKEIEKAKESSENSFDLMGTTTNEKPDDSSDHSLDLMGIQTEKKSKKKKKGVVEKTGKDRSSKKSPRGILKDKSEKKDKPAKKQVRFNFEGRFKESDPDRLPRPPLNVRQVSLDVSADFMPREYMKSEEEEMQITQALSNVFAFESMSADNLKTLINAFEPEEAEAGEEIVSPESEECDFYVVADGEVKVARDGKTIERLGSGETFGEENLFHRPARRVSISAVRKTQLFKVDQATYRSVLQVETRTVEKRKRELIEQLHLFDAMSAEMRQKIASIMKPAVFAKGATISSGKGETRRLYLIDKGIARTDDEAKRTFAGGDTLGEKGFRRGDAEVVEAVATTNVAAYYIDVPTYEKAIGSLGERIMPDIHSPKFKDMRPIVLGFDGMRFSKKKPLTIEESRAVVSLMEDVIFEKDEIILEAGVETPGCMFYLRRGTAESKSEPNQVSFIIPGTLFGGSFFKSALASKKGTAVSKENIVATDRCLISVLRLDDFLSTKKQYLKKLNHVVYNEGASSDSDNSDSESSSSDSSGGGSVKTKGHVFKLENIVKKTILGEGGFGQVWMVSDKTESEPKPYAFKIQSKHALVQAQHAEASIREKDIMAAISHPFVVKLLGSFQDEKFIYFLLNMMQGGELYTLMHPLDEDLSSNGMSEDQVKFYAFGIADALAHIHQKNIVYRDLKPENVLIDSHGYPVLVDFGLAKELKDGEKTFTLVGTPGYLAPEICINIGHSFGVDHWALGILIFEMLSGDGPFFYFGIDQVELYRSIVQEPHEVPENAGPDAADLVDSLLTKDPNGRLGNLSGGEADIMKHMWFKEMDIHAMHKRKVVAPWLPDIHDAFDTSNFEDWSELEDRTKEQFPELSPEDAEIFEAF